MTLTDLQKQITPLPWIWDGANLLSEETNETIAVNPRSGSDRKWIEQGRLSLDYARHCANNFPALVLALNQAREIIKQHQKGEPWCNTDDAAVANIKQALATAEIVKEL